VSVVDTAGTAWDDVVGQDQAVATLRSAAAGEPTHAWLFLGPRGSGKSAAAKAFAGELLAHDEEVAGDGDSAARARSLARTRQHPDLIWVEREGASISAAQADEIIRSASRSPIEGRRKVLVLDEFHLVAEGVGPKLLKTIEEPPSGTFFVVLADELPPELVTIASRCARVDFSPLRPEVVAARLEAEGIDPARAADAANFAGGDLERARLLATDERLALRLAAWRDLPRRLDGTGSRASVAIDELRAAIDDAEGPLVARQEAEAAEMAEVVERYGQRGSGAATQEARHKRERRRLRTDELRMGLAALAATYRDELTVAHDPTAALGALDAIQEAAEALIRNPNEQLLLTALALKLPTLNS
jgi:DNA polymerase-3 subunit delta'